MTVQPKDDAQNSARRGFFYALAAYCLWGFFPLYFRAVDFVPPAEVLVHRVVWSVPFALAVIAAQGRLNELKALFLNVHILRMMLLTAVLVSVNWIIFIWAISVNLASETALGYYINPLITVLMGFALLGERLTKLQMAAVLLAVTAVVIRTVAEGALPWISLTLAFSFALYGYFRKTVAVGPTQGFLVEVVLLSPFALAYWAWLVWQGDNHFSFADGSAYLLMLAGPVTAVPLILYAFGAKLLRLSTLGLMQYIAPSLIFVIAFTTFGEELGLWQAIAFGLIWTALALYSWEMLRQNRRSST